jgi:ketosteroid isomerase-like protein
MSVKDNKELVLTAYRSFGTQQPSTIASYFAPDAEWVAPERNGTPLRWGRRLASRGETPLSNISRKTSAGACSLSHESKVDLTAVVAEGDNVVVEQLFQATLYSGRPYKMMQCFIFVVRDGLIQQIRSFFDTAMGFELIFGDEEPRQLV